MHKAVAHITVELYCCIGHICFLRLDSEWTCFANYLIRQLNILVRNPIWWAIHILQLNLITDKVTNRYQNQYTFVMNHSCQFYHRTVK